MIKEYWGFHDYPFENTISPERIYRSPYHQEAILRMMYGIRNRKGAMIFTGEVGSGKTTVICYITYTFSGNKNEHSIVNIENPLLSGDDFLKEILFQFNGTMVNTSKIELLRELRGILSQNNKKGRGSLVIIDEAQLIDDPIVFEELRLLLNLQENGQFLLTLMLVGQPPLGDKIRSLPNLEQRVSIRYHLNPMERDDTEKYIKFRLRSFGGRGDIFSSEAIELIHKISQGLPRMINNICDMSLLLGAGAKLKVIGPDIIKNVYEDRSF